MAVISARAPKRSQCTRWLLKLLNQLSVGALSQQFPLRLIERIMPYFLAWFEGQHEGVAPNSRDYPG